MGMSVLRESKQWCPHQVFIVLSNQTDAIYQLGVIRVIDTVNSVAQQHG